MLVNSLLSALVLLTGVSAQVNTKSLVTCLTKQGPKATSPVKTDSKILTLPWYAVKIITSTPLRTTTPATSTTTTSTTVTVRTTTTLPVETDTITSTERETITDSTTTNVVVTSTNFASTTVFTTQTTTIAASAGFIPIKSSLPNSQKRAALRNNSGIPARDVPEVALEARAAKVAVKRTVVNGKAVCEPAQYPQQVKCVGLVVVITTKTQTRTASTTQVITAPTPIATVTVSITETLTITETPAQASTTKTTTSSTTTTTTVTEVATQSVDVTNTVTEEAPQATFYAACAENNIISSVNGQVFYASGFVSGSYQTLSVNSAYDCCVACINLAGCGSASYSASQSGLCYLDNNLGVCSQDVVTTGAFVGAQSNFVFSNGYCGRVTVV